MSTIVTFYSFKGGVGRTMALANIAILLARMNLRVLAIDWDLEAPGLDRYFESLVRRPLSRESGLLDIVIEYKERNAYPDWRRHVTKIDVKGEFDLSFIPSGYQDESYSGRVTKLDWNDLFSNRNGAKLFERLRSDWLNEYDVTLIDSRTGYNDTSGICTIQLPDVLVPVFTTNAQSFDGARSVVDQAQAGRQRLAFDRMPLLIFPLLSRFDARTEFTESQLWLDRIAEESKSLFDDWLPREFEPIDIIQKTKIPYVAFFSYGEKLPVLTHGTEDPELPGYAYAACADLISQNFQNAAEIITGIRSVRERGRDAEMSRIVIALRSTLDSPRELLAYLDEPALDGGQSAITLRLPSSLVDDNSRFAEEFNAIGALDSYGSVLYHELRRHPSIAYAIDQYLSRPRRQSASLYFEADDNVAESVVWEALRSDAGFLAITSNVGIGRILKRMERASESNYTLSGSLRVMVVLGSGNVEERNDHAEWDGVWGGLREGIVKSRGIDVEVYALVAGSSLAKKIMDERSSARLRVDIIPDVVRLRTRIERFQPHVLHLFGAVLRSPGRPADGREISFLKWRPEQEINEVISAIKVGTIGAPSAAPWLTVANTRENYGSANFAAEAVRVGSAAALGTRHYLHEGRHGEVGRFFYPDVINAFASIPRDGKPTILDWAATFRKARRALADMSPTGVEWLQPRLYVGSSEFHVSRRNHGRGAYES